ncbi:TetR/AcrR family transcriptional regulator [Cryptosporangium aurantiacum]|uniref:Transcriptional regulator, TetR family n=1 Tax=Cryptosporangium aurantiacum TaxID=134849 RepID=A0A1M7RJT7_9ACTN|nr:TetR/AcrR family transcriptional regulator [Cryptosporangium aurantiacum]SHN46534.1 transcriptional regulator, TetR family [Cryptosporangium aurantiacum]
MVTQAQGAGGGLPLEGMPAWQRARRQRIVDAALAALQRQEYEQIQIRDVAQVADVALGTLYRYFSSKEHLYAAVLQEWAALGRAGTTRSRRRSAEARVRARMHGVIKAFERQPQFYKVHMLLQSSSDPNVKALRAEFAESAQAMLAEDFAVLGADRADDAATMLWSIINTMLSQAIYHGGSMAEVYRIADRFIDLLAPELAEAALAP